MRQLDWDNERDRADNASSPTPALVQEAMAVEAGEFEAAFGETLAQALDLDTWHPGEDLANLYGRLELEIEAAVRQENRIRDRIRQIVFPRLRTRPGAPANAGVYQARIEDIERVHSGLLFNGAVEACDGTSVLHDTLPVTIAQIGVCLVSYQGDQGSWVQRLFRRDLRVGGLDPVQEVLEVLDRRQQRTGFDMESRRDKLTDLGRRAIMAYAERAVLVKKSNALWRMGHGNPTPYELLTGSGMYELVENSLDLLHELVAKHKRFVFVPSAPAQRTLLTIGNALRPLEYAIIDTSQVFMKNVVEGHYRGKWGASIQSRVRQFAGDLGPKIVIGAYRASALGPPQLFYAHAEFAHEAALIVLADSVLQEHRGFPMLIDLADTVCTTIFGTDSLVAPAKVAYVEAGEPFRYLTERQTRR